MKIITRDQFDPSMFDIKCDNGWAQMPFDKRFFYRFLSGRQIYSLKGYPQWDTYEIAYIHPASMPESWTEEKMEKHKKTLSLVYKFYPKFLKGKDPRFNVHMTMLVPESFAPLEKRIYEERARKRGYGYDDLSFEQKILAIMTESILNLEAFGTLPPGDRMRSVRMNTDMTFMNAFPMTAKETELFLNLYFADHDAYRRVPDALYDIPVTGAPSKKDMDPDRQRWGCTADTKKALEEGPDSVLVRKRKEQAEDAAIRTHVSNMAQRR